MAKQVQKTILKPMYLHIWKAVDLDSVFHPVRIVYSNSSSDDLTIRSSHYKSKILLNNC